LAAFNFCHSLQNRLQSGTPKKDERTIAGGVVPLFGLAVPSAPVKRLFLCFNNLFVELGDSQPHDIGCVLVPSVS